MLDHEQHAAPFGQQKMHDSSPDVTVHEQGRAPLDEAVHMSHKHVMEGHPRFCGSNVHIDTDLTCCHHSSCGTFAALNFSDCALHYVIQGISYA